MNFCKGIYQPILRYLYTEIIKRGGEISLHKHFKKEGVNHGRLFYACSRGKDNAYGNF